MSTILTKILVSAAYTIRRQCLHIFNRPLFVRKSSQIQNIARSYWLGNQQWIQANYNSSSLGCRNYAKAPKGKGQDGKKGECPMKACKDKAKNKSKPKVKESKSKCGDENKPKSEMKPCQKEKPKTEKKCDTEKPKPDKKVEKTKSKTDMKPCEKEKPKPEKKKSCETEKPKPEKTSEEIKKPESKPCADKAKPDPGEAAKKECASKCPIKSADTKKPEEKLGKGVRKVGAITIVKDSYGTHCYIDCKMMVGAKSDFAYPEKPVDPCSIKPRECPPEPKKEKAPAAKAPVPVSGGDGGSKECGKSCTKFKYKCPQYPTKMFAKRKKKKVEKKWEY